MIFEGFICINYPRSYNNGCTIVFQPSMTQYRNNSTETGCQSPTSPHSQPSYSPSQSPGLSPHSWNNKVFEMDPYHVQQQQQTNALQHQFEQFNMVGKLPSSDTFLDHTPHVQQVNSPVVIYLLRSHSPIMNSNKQMLYNTSLNNLTW